MGRIKERAALTRRMLPAAPKPRAARASLFDPRVARVMRYAFDAASDSRLVDFSSATDIGTNEALRGEIVTLRQRIRFELRNNSLARGMGRTYANVVANRGARLKLQGPDKKWNHATEFAFNRWARHAGYRFGESLGELTHLGLREMFPCGEYFMVPRMDLAATTAEKLRFLLLRPDRVQSPDGSMGDGVEADQAGKPLKYFVLDDDPDNLNTSRYWMDRKFSEVPAAVMIHVFVQEDPIQFRGVPWLAAALTVFHKLRRADEGELSSIEMANKFAGFLKNTMSEFAVDAEVMMPSTMDLEDGTLTTLPPGYEPTALKPEHPANRLSEFRRDQLAAIGRSAAMPVNAVTGDSSKHNFASARFDGLMLTTDGDVVRGTVEGRSNDRVFAMWLAEATYVGTARYPSAPYDPAWLWPRNEAHSDPNKQASAQEKRLKNGTATVGDEVLARGVDDVDHLERLKDEVETWRAAGLRHPLDAQGGAVAGEKGSGLSREEIEEIAEEVFSAHAKE